MDPGLRRDDGKEGLGAYLRRASAIDRLPADS
jgi:hypothetical protein